MDNILVVLFDGECQAHEGYTALRRLHAKGDITLCGEALITKDLRGRVVLEESSDQSLTESVERLATGSVIGLLGPVGDVVAAETVDRVAGYLEPGKWAVIAEVQEESTTLADSQLEAAGGRVFRRAATFTVNEQIGRDVSGMRGELARLEAEYERAQGEAKAGLRARIDAARAKLPKARDGARK